MIDGAARFAEGEYAPLNRPGDIQGAKWNGGAVTMPEGFREAYQAFVENGRSEEHTSELQSLMRSSYAVLCLKKKTTSKRSLAQLVYQKRTSHNTREDRNK